MLLARGIYSWDSPRWKTGSQEKKESFGRELKPIVQRSHSEKKKMARPDWESVLAFTKKKRKDQDTPKGGKNLHRKDYFYKG